MSDDARRLLAGISLIAALVIGLYCWSRSRPGSTPPLPVVSAESAPAPSPRAAIARPIDAAPIASKPAPGAAARASAAAIAAAPAAAPASAPRVPFPSDLPRAFTAEAFHDELARVVAECRFPYEISEEDCTEFPCIAWGKWSGASISVDACPSWHDTFGSKDFVFARPDAEGNSLAGIAAFPPGIKVGGDELKQLRARADGMIQTRREEREPRRASPSKLTGQELAHK